MAADSTPYSPQKPDPELSPQPMSSRAKMTFFVMLIIGYLLAFVGGYFLNTTLASGQPTPTPLASSTPLPTTIVESSPTTEVEQPQPVQLPQGKKYFLDTVMMIDKAAPHAAFISTANRVETNTGYSQSIRTSYFDGQKWLRKIHSAQTNSSTIVPNSLLTAWNETIDPTRVLKESVTGSERLDDHLLSFETGPLQNEVGMRSLPSNTKFLSSGQGTFTVDSETHQAWVLYTKHYSDDASEIQVYDDSLGITTDWLAFWDFRGNFYHIDVTKVDKPSATYQSHQIGIFDDLQHRVSKTFRVDVERSNTNPPDTYTISLREPISSKIQLNLLSYNDKVPPQNTYRWILGVAKGTVTNAAGESLPGVGMLEYIYEH